MQPDQGYTSRYSFVFSSRGYYLAPGRLLSAAYEAVELQLKSARQFANTGRPVDPNAACAGS